MAGIYHHACCCGEPPATCEAFSTPHADRVTPSGYTLQYGGHGGATWSFAYEGDAFGTHEWERSLDRRRVSGRKSDCTVLFAWKDLVYAAGVLDVAHAGQSADFKVTTGDAAAALPVNGNTYGRFGHTFVNTTGYYETGPGSGVALDFEPYYWEVCQLGGYALSSTNFDPKADELDARMVGGPRTLGLTGTFTFLAVFSLRSYKVGHSASGYVGPLPPGTVLVTADDGQKHIMEGHWYRS